MTDDEDIWAEDYVDDDDVEAQVATEPPVGPAEMYEALNPLTPVNPARRLRYRDPPKGNTKRSDAAAARTAALAQAQAKDRTEKDEWREQMDAGDRSAAIGTLSSSGLTHNAGHGFGPADQPRYD